MESVTLEAFARSTSYLNNLSDSVELVSQCWPFITHTGLGMTEHFVLATVDLSKTGKGYFSLPGGSTNVGEKRWEAAKRELKEECGIGLHDGVVPVLVSWGVANGHGDESRLYFVPVSAVKSPEAPSTPGEGTPESGGGSGAAAASAPRMSGGLSARRMLQGSGGGGGSGAGAAGGASGVTTTAQKPSEKKRVRSQSGHTSDADDGAPEKKPYRGE